MSARAYDALIDARDVERLMGQRDSARAERDRLRAIAREGYALLSEALGSHDSHAAEAEFGRRVARWLRQNAADAGSVL